MDDVAYKKPQVDEEQRKRKRFAMPRWNCEGHVTIQVDRRDMSRVVVRYGHNQDHVHYTDIILSKDAVDYISANLDRTPSEIHSKLRRKYAEKDKPVHFTQKQVHARWTHENERVWKLDPDELASAALVLEKYASDDIEILSLPIVTGAEAFAFAVKKALVTRGPLVHEVGMDSTCKQPRYTNGGVSRFQCIDPSWLRRENQRDGTRALRLRCRSEWSGTATFVYVHQDEPLSTQTFQIGHYRSLSLAHQAILSEHQICPKRQRLFGD
ncbi:hypothetical protein QFC24_004052 [Naganishia onofrii]|uniref:Uncharacterized protein n=1 Tax=Naganishia onofrii TaxID=1851511 RepID=A0ACC2XGQ4_9TREE|nr:hypothetical protein QFC24_004052 [Naganishia onofrii]